jgi:hypothetical protein
LKLNVNNLLKFKKRQRTFCISATRSAAFYFREIRNQLRYADILP